MKDHNSEGPPCSHMESLLHKTADGTAGRWQKLYALAHAARCPRCSRFLDRMSSTLDMLKKTKPEADSSALERLKQGKWKEEIKK